MTLSWSPPIRLNPINYKVCNVSTTRVFWDLLLFVM
jgi:hypothetical protein